MTKMKKYYGNALVTLIAVDDRIRVGIDKSDEVSFIERLINLITKSDWFTRAWTFQEGMLSKQTIFMFDDALVDGRRLTLAWCCLQKDYSEKLTKHFPIFITPLGCSYLFQKQQWLIWHLVKL